MNKYYNIKQNPSIIDQYKHRELISMECDFCHSSFGRTKQSLKISLKRGDKNCFCSRNCLGQFQTIGKSIEISCTNCGKVFIKRSCDRKNPSSKDFCSQSCSAKYNNRHRSKESRAKQAAAVSKTMTERIKERVKQKLPKTTQLEYTRVDRCVICDKWFPEILRNRRKTCSEACLHESFVKSGIYAASTRTLRSKDEIALFELCASYFPNVTNNEQLVKGWDADIIIHDTKTAILWNGPWHYRDMPGLVHSLKQVQNRDRIKTKELSNAGWKVLAFEDRYYTPQTAFEEIIGCGP